MWHYCVWNSVVSMQYQPEWIGIGVRKYLTECYFLRVHTFYHVLLVCHFIACLHSSPAQDGTYFCVAHKKIDLHAAHEVLLTCFLLSCSTWSIDRVQRMKYSSRAAHESLFTCSPFCVTCTFWLSHLIKIEEHTRVQHTQVST